MLPVEGTGGIKTSDLIKERTWLASMSSRRKTGVEQRDGKRRGRVCRVMSRACQVQPSENVTGTACPTRRRKSRRRTKRTARGESLARVQHPLEEEDWEKEIKESSPIEDWDNETYDSVYDPEDVICSGMLQATLNSQPHCIGHAHYSPAVHHVSPVKWVQHVPHIVVDQFIDAEE
ncbi:hypothetical protein SKAU_G00123440 [Synaphobranchus kaupii]|uniref:Uncharacterized protein n=1 Tax=Synaphobranchus kaupii TaxID=118154 RepID=A0A9Q1J2M7_SYNKA|nr:hypothetical protein SKAU_G00123440 [Synaphobranchus kaupii]